MRIMLTAILFFVSLCSLHSQESNYELLKKIAAVQSANRADYLTPRTRLDTVMAVPEDTLLSVLTLLNANKNTSAMKEFKEKMEPALLKYISENRKMRSLLERKVVFVYRYYFKNHEYFYSIYLTPEKYLKLIS